MEERYLGFLDAQVHLLPMEAEYIRSLWAMRKEAAAMLETASKNAKIAIVRNMAFPMTTESWSRAIGNLTIWVSIGREEDVLILTVGWVHLPFWPDPRGRPCHLRSVSTQNQSGSFRPLFGRPFEVYGRNGWKTISGRHSIRQSRRANSGRNALTGFRCLTSLNNKAFDDLNYAKLPFQSCQYDQQVR